MYAHLMQAPAKEIHVSKFIRQFHRWTSIAFALVVAAIFAMLGLGQQPAQWLYYVPLAPLFLLFITGLYMFFLPYVAKARRGKAS
jgi:ABC-type polysaccharide/polyol phosphate export permease